MNEGIICVGDIVNLTITDPVCYKLSKMQHWNGKKNPPAKTYYIINDRDIK